MTWVRTGFGSLLLAAASVGSALAQRAGTVELGVFGRFTSFDHDLNFRDRLGIGARVGAFVASNLAVEGDGSYTSTQGQGKDLIRSIPLHARLVYHAPIGERYALLIGAGYTRNLFRKDYRETRSGVGGVLGVRFARGPFALRLEATGDYIPTAESNFLPPQEPGVNQAKSNWHWSGQAGGSYRIGGRRNGDRDRDRDGVRDSADQCPNTPVGDAVASNGCSLPKDGDGDGVIDRADRCPHTPAGDKVDVNGCSIPKDSDGDGVFDAADRCPNTPQGDEVDGRGCSLPRDRDNDGVPDPQDRCPNSPAGEAVDATGCLRDGDHDGVSDTIDRCPATSPGDRVDAGGCALPKDGDGDGVIDDNDRCPNTPAGAKVDAVGCELVFETGRGLVLEGVNFETGKAAILPASEAILDRVAQSLLANPAAKVEIGGHTDSRGARTANLNLSETRAAAVKAYLVRKGVDADRLATRGYGPDQPIGDNGTPQGRAQNRRVELKRTN